MVVLFQTLYLIEEMVNEQSYTKQEIAAFLAWEKEPHNWANAQEEVLAGALGGCSLFWMFLSSKTETSASRSPNTPCQVGLTELVFLDVYMATAWTSYGLLPNNMSGKTSASVAADSELANSLWCDIGVSSECCECPKTLESPSITTVRATCSSCFLIWKMVSSHVTFLSLSTQQHLDWSSLQCPTVTMAAQHYRPGGRPTWVSRVHTQLSHWRVI